MAKKTKKPSIKKILMIISTTAVICFIASVIFVDLRVTEQSVPFIYTQEEQIKPIKVGLILGASVWNNRVMSAMLQDRADGALALYQAGKIKKFLVSGDNRQPDYNEVIVVKNYLLAKGVPESDIFLDYAGFDTYDSLYRAREIFQVKELVIVTQKFHLPRAIYLARNLGLKAIGLAADRHDYRNIEFNYWREKIANLKAFLDISLSIQPKFLGDPIPII